MFGSQKISLIVLFLYCSLHASMSFEIIMYKLKYNMLYRITLRSFLYIWKRILLLACFPAGWTTLFLFLCKKLTILCRLRIEEREQNENIFSEEERQTEMFNFKIQPTTKSKKWKSIIQFRQLKGTGNIHFYLYAHWSKIYSLFNEEF